jgi:thioredoxin-related protein
MSIFIMMRFFYGFVVCIAMLFSMGCSQETEELPLYSQVYDTNRDAQADFTFAMERAKKSQRPILMFVGGDWCSWCQALDSFLSKTPAVNDFLHKHFVLLKVYYGRDNRNTKFLSSLPPFRGTPHFYVFGSEGNILHSQQTEVLEQGQSYDELKLMTFLEKWAPGVPIPQPKARPEPSAAQASKAAQ